MANTPAFSRCESITINKRAINRKQFLTVALFLFLLLSIFTLKAQEPCGTMQLLKEQLKNDPGMQKRMDERDKQIKMYTANPQLLNDDLIIIPVVVHVIYHTAAENISDAQIESQIAVLNEDFMRQNADTVNTPDIFKDRAANINIRFALATRDPNGDGTCGITRTYTDSTVFRFLRNMKFRDTGGHEAWPQTGYLNIWVCNFSTYRGFATLPNNPDAYDGIVVTTNAFGRGSEFNLLPGYNLGRTATHEVGHWLQLDHIWGGPGCDLDDGISDTPSADLPHYTNSPCTFPVQNSCVRLEYDGTDQPDMFQNYMDYSLDVCMNLFTNDQKALMRAAFAERGSRVGIRSLKGLSSPVACNELKLNFKYDANPEDISWTIVNKSTNDTVAVGKKYERPNEWTPVGVREDTYNFCLADGDYTFTIVDSYGDGMPEGGGNYILKSRFDTLHISNGDFGAGESFDFNVNDQYYRFVGPGTDWHDDANWNRAVPSPCTDLNKITIESDCIKADGLEINPPNVLHIKHGVTFLAENGGILGLVAYYPFNGNANDESANNNNGIVNGATLTTDRFGNPDKAYAFDGVDDRINANVGAEMYSAEKTISVWAMVSGAGSVNPRLVGVGPHGASQQHYAMLLEGETSPRRLWFFTSYIVTNAFSTALIPNSAQWNHYTITIKENTAKIYINGTLDSETTLTRALTNFTSALLQIGYSDNGLDWFNGKLDDIRIYNRGLSDAEVTAIYNSEKP